MTKAMPTPAPQTSLRATAPDKPQYSEAAGRRRRLLPLVILLVISLVMTAVTRTLVYNKRESLQTTIRSEKRLRGVDTFALGLILGGLRGPLIMFLWPSIESQKIDRNLEDIDTKIELVRMLQPEFDSVHLFQIWNKAYNISVQMASIPNKYATILDALDYASRVNEERPDNVNIISAYGEVYFNKLGNSAEKKQFIKRVRAETMAGGPAREAAPRRDDKMQKTRHEVLLDEKGYLLPQYLQPRWERGGTMPQKLRDAGYTGAPLQFLGYYSTPDMGGFPYGVSPIAIGYNYYERAAVLARVTGQKHIQVGDTVMDSRPPVTLKFWAEEEMERARRLEIALAGKPQPEDRADRWLLDEPTASMALDAQLAMGGSEAEAAVDEILFSLRRATQVGGHAIREYRRHINDYKFSPNASNFESHIDTLRAMILMAEADHAYVQLLAAAKGIRPLDEAKRRELVQLATERYTQSMQHHYGTMLRFYVEDEAAAATYPPLPNDPTKRYGKNNIMEADPKLYAEIFQATRKYLAEKKRGDYFPEDVREHTTHIRRASQRLEQLGKVK